MRVGECAGTDRWMSPDPGRFGRAPGHRRNEPGPVRIQRVAVIPESRAHWPEYSIEAACLAAFMLSAAAFTTLLQHPASPLSRLDWPPVLLRLPLGLAMGLTLIAIVYSPWGLRSGAHLNPAVTLTFLRLGRIGARDAAGYITAQFAGGLLGIVGATLLLAGLPADPPVRYVTTVPGPAGPLAAFAAEAAISFGMMLLVLGASAHPRHQHRTGLFAGVFVAACITVEAPLSGMSMNPARSFGPALLAGTLDSIWIYAAAPLVGMLLAADVFGWVRGHAHVRCAKLVHPPAGACHFRCGRAAPLQEVL